MSEPVIYTEPNARGAGRRAFVSSYLALAVAVVLGAVFAYISGSVGIVGIAILAIAYVVYLLGFLIPWAARGFTYREHPGGAAMGLLIGIVFVPAVLSTAIGVGFAARALNELSTLRDGSVASSQPTLPSDVTTPSAAPAPSETPAPGLTSSDSYLTDGTQVCGQDLSMSQYAECQEQWEYGAEADNVIDEQEADIFVNQFGASCDADGDLPGSYVCEVGDVTFRGGQGD